MTSSAVDRLRAVHVGHLVASYCRVNGARFWKAWMVCLLVFMLTAVAMVRYDGLLTLESVVNGVVLLSESSPAVDLDMLENACRKSAHSGRGPREIELSTAPSATLWDGVDVEALASVRGRRLGVDGADADQTAVGTAYRPALNASERALLRRLLVAFDGAAREGNVTYFLYGGSLIGSYRHHGMIPWDDDVDIAAYVGHRRRLREALARLPVDYRFLPTADRWKLFLRARPVIRRQMAWSFPFVDVSFFNVTARGLVVDVDGGWARRGFRYDACNVFPLVRRPFWDLWLPAPRRAAAVLSATYRLDRCDSISYSHALERYVKQAFTVSCRRLRRFYPFVERHTINNTTEVERLVFNNTELHRIIVST